jgi:ubiquinone/menaquinone biosynthesis C-methylase UbiE
MVGAVSFKKEKLKNAFDELSATFNEVAGQPMARFTRLLLREISLPDNPVCLDVGCGTGISTFELARIVPDGGAIYGIEFFEAYDWSGETECEKAGSPGHQILDWRRRATGFP